MPDPIVVPQVNESPIDKIRDGLARHAAVLDAAKTAGAATQATTPATTVQAAV